MNNLERQTKVFFWILLLGFALVFAALVIGIAFLISKYVYLINGNKDEMATIVSFVFTYIFGICSTITVQSLPFFKEKK